VPLPFRCRHRSSNRRKPGYDELDGIGSTDDRCGIKALSRAQRPDVRDLFQAEDRVINRRVFWAKHRRDQIATSPDLFARHRFPAVPRTVSTRSLARLPSVNATSTMATRFGVFERRVRDELHPLAQLEDLRILHPRLVVRRGEGRSLVHEHDRDHVLQADVRHVAIVHDRGFARRDANDDLLNGVGIERLALSQVLERVERRLNR
jgi:hypothetical protein